MIDGLHKFFSEPNTLSEDFLRNADDFSDWGNHVKQWTTSYKKNRDVLALPLVRNEEHVEWFVGTSNHMVGRWVEKELAAFFGASLGICKYSLLNFDEKNNFHVIVKNFFSGPIYLIQVSGNESINLVREKLSLYGKVLFNKPKEIANFNKPFSQIRKEFDLAIMSGDEDTSRKALQELKNAGRLTVENNYYLEIRFLVGLKKWESFNLNHLTRIRHFRVPLSVINDIAEYYFETSIKKFLDTADLDSCLTELKTRRFKEFKNFFSRRYVTLNISTSYVYLVAFLFKENLDKAFQIEILKLVRERYPSNLLNTVEEYLNKSHIKAIEKNEDPETIDPFILISNFIDDEDYDSALELCLKLPPSKKSVQKVFQCFKSDLPDQITLRDPLYVNRILEYFNRLDTKEKIDLSSNVTGGYKQLEEILSNPKVEIETPSSWMSWLHAVEENLTPKRSKEVIESLSKAWDVTEISGDRDNFDYFVEKLFSGNEEMLRCFNEAFAYIYSSFTDGLDDYPQYMGNLFIELLNHLAITEELLSVEQRKKCIIDLQQKSLELGLSKEIYGELVDACVTFCAELSSPVHLDWMLDLIENFTEYPKSDPSAFTNLFGIILVDAKKFSKRLSLYQKSIVNDLCLVNKFNVIDFSSGELANGDRAIVETNILSEALTGKTLAIYTLNENSGRRVQQIIKKQVPSCDVKLNSDKFGTEKLKALAQNSDYFVAVWRRSKHAATNYIEQFRATNDIIKPAGFGSTGIINAITNFVS